MGFSGFYAVSSGNFFQTIQDPIGPIFKGEESGKKAGQNTKKQLES